MTGIVLLSLLFMFDGLQKLIDPSHEQKKFNAKMYNTQAWLNNHNLLLCKFEHCLKGFSKMIIKLVSVGEILGGSGMLFFEEREKRSVCAGTLVLASLFDAFALHLPFVEYGKQVHYES